MVLASAPIEGQAHSIADWVEFNAITAEYNVYRLSNLLRLVDEEQEEENTDFTEQDATNEGLLELVTAELQFRIECLSTAYPFHFNDTQTEFVFQTDLTEGNYIYLYCLFFSHIKQEDVLVVDPPSSHEDRDLMQICSTYAAAGITGDSAVSFGFPRPDHSNFLEGLKSTYQDFGEGEVCPTVPPGAPPNEKDARVDIIAWNKSLDGGPGRTYLLGQVASGQNWSDKSIVGEIDPFHNIWFTQKPASTHIAAMFIPFCLDLHKGATLRDMLQYLTYKFGHLYYRYRLPKYAEIGFDLAKNDTEKLHRIDRYAEYGKIQIYVDKFLATIK